MSQIAKWGFAWGWLVLLGVGSLDFNLFSSHHSGDRNISASSQVLSSKGHFLEPQEIEEISEEESETSSPIDLPGSLRASNPVFANREHWSLLSLYSGRLQFLNIPPPQKA